MDYRDAFCTMQIAEAERRRVVAKGTESYYAFRRVAFGLASGPLLWGRLAAAMARMLQGITPNHSARTDVP